MLFKPLWHFKLKGVDINQTNFLSFIRHRWVGGELKVELVRYTQDPVVTAGKAGGVCYDKEEKEDYGKFIQGNREEVGHGKATKTILRIRS